MAAHLTQFAKQTQKQENTITQRLAAAAKTNKRDIPLPLTSLNSMVTC